MSAGSAGGRRHFHSFELTVMAPILGAMWVKLVAFDWLLHSSSAAGMPGVTPVASSLALLLVLLAALLCLPRGAQLVLLVAIDLLLTVLVQANVIFLRRYDDVLRVSSFSDAWQLARVPDSVLALLTPGHSWLWLDLAAAAVLALWLGRRSRAAPPLPLGRRARLAGFVLAVALAGLALPARAVWRDEEEVFSLMWKPSLAARAIGLLAFSVYDAAAEARGAVVRHALVSAEDRARVAGIVRERQACDGTVSSLFGAARGRNLIVVMVESLQAFVIGLRIDGAEITPRLNALVRQSLHFPRFYDQSWGATTADGEFASLASLYPLASGAASTRFAGNEYRALPRVLAEHGYGTVSAHAFDTEFWNARVMHRRLGFDTSYFARDYAPGEMLGLGLADADFFEQTVPRLAARRRPFMAYLVTLTSHHPYTLPARHRVMRLRGLEQSALGDYLHAARYVDGAIGRFVDQLTTQGLLDQSMLVIYGDHRNYLEDDQGGPPDVVPTRARTDRFGLPFLIRLPRGEAAGTYPVTGGHLDVAPTLLALLGIEAPASMLGSDLTRGRDALVARRDGSYTDGRVLFLPDPGERDRGRCFAFESGAVLDPSACRDGLREARLRLATSDLILEGDLVPRLDGPPGSDAAGSPSGPDELLQDP